MLTFLGKRNIDQATRKLLRKSDSVLGFFNANIPAPVCLLYLSPRILPDRSRFNWWLDARYLIFFPLNYIMEKREAINVYILLFSLSQA